ncbi:HDOD domain-containing protein [Oscillospiraceae bacterium PP1C4]
METYIVRQPILDATQQVIAYEILYQQNESDLFGRADITIANAIEDFLIQVNSEKFLDGKTAYITFTPNLLLRNIPRMFPKEKLVIQIDDSCIVHPLAQKIIYRYKKQGYKIAINGFEFAPRYFGMLDVVDIIKIDISTFKNSSLQNIINIATSFNKEIITYNVNTPKAYEYAKQSGCKYMQGNCVAEQFTSKIHRMDHMQSNFFQLMVAVTKDEPDIDEIAVIISRDVTLAFSLMKLVNSAYFALRNRANSVKQALIILGLGQLKQWIYLLSFKQDSGGISEQLIKTSFLRASFCAELSQYAANLPASKSEAYMLGMFSMLGLLLEVPLDSALEELPISDEVKKALIIGEGQCGILYRLILCYESADWRGISQCAEQLGIPMAIITQKYFECVEYVNVIWHELTIPYDSQAEESDLQKANV